MPDPGRELILARLVLARARRKRNMRAPPTGLTMVVGKPATSSADAKDPRCIDAEEMEDMEVECPEGDAEDDEEQDAVRERERH